MFFVDSTLTPVFDSDFYLTHLADLLAAIQTMIGRATANLITVMDRKFEHLEKRQAALETESMIKNGAEKVNEKLATQEKRVEELE